MTKKELLEILSNPEIQPDATIYVVVEGLYQAAKEVDADKERNEVYIGSYE